MAWNRVKVKENNFFFIFAKMIKVKNFEIKFKKDIPIRL